MVSLDKEFKGGIIHIISVTDISPTIHEQYVKAELWALYIKSNASLNISGACG